MRGQQHISRYHVGTRAQWTHTLRAFRLVFLEAFRCVWLWLKQSRCMILALTLIVVYVFRLPRVFLELAKVSLTHHDYRSDLLYKSRFFLITP